MTKLQLNLVPYKIMAASEVARWKEIIKISCRRSQHTSKMKTNWRRERNKLLRKTLLALISNKHLSLKTIRTPLRAPK